MSRALLCAVALVTSATAVAADAGPKLEYYTTPSETPLPFSDAVRVGDLLFVSGKLGAPPGQLKLVPGGIQPETRQTMENIRAILARSGATLDDVIRCTVMMADMKEWGAMNQVYAGFFPRHRPARSAFGATGLALGARVEIECIALVPPA